jgi:hypothetical protein
MVKRKKKDTHAARYSTRLIAFVMWGSLDLGKQNEAAGLDRLCTPNKKRPIFRIMSHHGTK